MDSKIKGFYSSIAWQKCREAYKKKTNYLCEECLKNGIITPAEEVHHIKKITRRNVKDPNITLNFANLQSLCKKHHLEKHDRFAFRRYTIDEFGHVTPKEDNKSPIQKNNT